MFRSDFRRIRVLACTLAAVAMTAATSLHQSAAAQEEGTAALAAEMIRSLGSEKGLCIVLGAEDGELMVELCRDGQYLVHGLCSSGEAVGRAREDIAKAELRGVVSAETGSVARLPYSDNIVNLLVAENLRALLQDGLTLKQVLRVLRPGGVAWLGSRAHGKDALTAGQLREMLAKAGIKDPVIVERHGVWAQLKKPRPASMDAWTHGRADGSGNPVSADTQIGVSTGVRWVAGPNWPTGNRKSAVPAAVVSKEHLVYVFEDEVATADGTTLENSLIARDAYNGLRLWRRKSDSNDLVSVDGQVFTKVGDRLVALDGGTGKVVRTFDVEAPGQFLLSDGLLVVAGSKGITAFDSESGQSRWSASHKPKAMRAGDGHLFINTDLSRRGGESHLVRLDLKTGDEQWAASTKSWDKGTSFDLILYSDGVLVLASGRGNHAVSAKDGSHLWDYTYPRIGHGGSYTKVMHSGGLVWVHTADSKGSGQYAWEGLDPQTGEMKRRLLQPKEFQYKHRCSADVATDNFVLCGSMAFADLKTDDYQRFGAARTSCRTAGLVPANGLVYTFPHACGCYDMLRGFLALETNPETGSSAPPAEDRLEKGPVYGSAIDTSDSASGWPTYRHDISRSGSTDAAGPAGLTRLWEHKVGDRVAKAVELEWDQKDGGRLTSPVVAGGLALVGDSDFHRLSALDAVTGKPRWSFTSGGRIDCPPTVHGGLCLFGSHDGWVYCVTSAEGKLVWRFRAAPQDRRIVAYGQLESACPVVGGVLVYNGLAYFVVGRHGLSDGGILAYAVEPKTGKLVWTAPVEGHNGVPDVLTAGGGTIQMAAWEVDAKTGKPRSASQGRLRGGRLGLLNDAWYKRPIAIRRNLSQWSSGDRPTGQMLAFNETATCGYRACGKVNTGDGEMSGNALLFAKPASGKEWSVKMPTTARLCGMVLAGERLYVAGLLHEGEKEKNANSRVRMYSLGDGKLLAEHVIEDRLVHDCLAVADGRLYIATQGGALICLGNK